MCIGDVSGSEFKMMKKTKRVITESIEKRHEFRNRLLSGVAWARFGRKGLWHNKQSLLRAWRRERYSPAPEASLSRIPRSFPVCCKQRHSLRRKQESCEKVLQRRPRKGDSKGDRPGRKAIRRVQLSLRLGRLKRQNRHPTFKQDMSVIVHESP